MRAYKVLANRNGRWQSTALTPHRATKGELSFCLDYDVSGNSLVYPAIIGTGIFVFFDLYSAICYRNTFLSDDEDNSDIFECEVFLARPETRKSYLLDGEYLAKYWSSQKYRLSHQEYAPWGTYIAQAVRIIRRLRDHDDASL